MRFSEYALPNGELKLFHSTVPPGERAYNAHHHALLEISMPVKGSGIYRVKDTEYSFGRGDIFIFAADEPHCVTYISDKERFELLNIQLESRLLYGGGDAAYLPLLRLFNSRPDNFENKIPSEAAAAKSAVSAAAEIENEFLHTLPGYELKIKLLLFSMLLSLYRHFGFSESSDSPTAHSAELLSLLSEAVKYMNLHFTEDLSLSDIAEHVHLSRSYFCSAFKKYNGISPFDYITIKRVEKAVEYIKTTNLSKLEIASLSGFSSPSNFYKAFSKITGKKPGDYIF